jgi:hypothetical protein
MRKTFPLWGALVALLIATQAMAQLPPTPGNLVAQVTPTATPGIKLTWQLPMTPMMGGLFFKINRSTDDSAHFEAIGLVGEKSYQDWHVSPGHTYFYTVNSVVLHDSSVLQSPPSNIAWATIGSPTPRPHGFITGTVTDSVSGMPLPFVRMIFFREAMGLHAVWQTWTDLSGKYGAVLDTGTYVIKAQPMIWMPMVMFPIPLYFPEWYKDAREVAGATPVVVGDSAEITADLDLERIPPPRPASISGTVTDTLGNPLKGALVVFMRSIPEEPLLNPNGAMFPGMGDQNIDIDDVGRMCGVFGKALTDSLGHYTAHVLAGKSYVGMAMKRGFLPQFFDHKRDPRDADIIKIAQDTTGFDFALTPRSVEANSISGMVRDSAGTGIPSRIVLIPLVRPWGARFGTTDSVGTYSIAHVRAGKYFVLALPLADYAPAFYKAGAYGVLQWKDADTVSITGAVTGIDIGVVPIHSDGPTSLAGNVTSNGLPVSGVNVFALNPVGMVVGYGMTDPSGAYSITGLPAGQTTLVADRDGYMSAQGSVNIGPMDYSVNGGTLVLTPVGATSVGSETGTPVHYSLGQNYPNPFNPSTSISFELPAMSQVTLEVFNLLGQQVAVVASGTKAAGRYTVSWDASKMASGVYFYRLTAIPAGGGQTFTSLHKMVLLK